MKKPLILRLPPRFRQSITSRIYLKQFSKWLPLFASAELHFCPGISMFDLIPGDVISGNIAFNGFYELELTREIARLSAKGGLLVDIGANMGVLLASVGRVESKWSSIRF